MSDGCKENGRDSTRSADDFVRAISKIAVAQICETEGFQGVQQSALEVFADVAVRYVREIGKNANLYANLAGRQECNVLDVILGLEDLGSIQGFPGASDVLNHSVASSGVVREIKQYVGLNDEIPFAYLLPRFPVSKEPKFPPSFIRVGVDPPGEHIPAWLPVFPNQERDTIVSNCNGEVNFGGSGLGEEPVNIVEKGEPSSLMSMQQRLSANNGQELVFAHGDSSKGKRVVDVNPFLAAPLLYGEKDVSAVAPPPRFLGGGVMMNHVVGNMMEGFVGPPIEAPQSKLVEDEERDKTMELDGRPIVRFKFRSVRKSFCASKNVIGHNDGDEDEVFGGSMDARDDEKDEMKRGAEKILKESMENPSDEELGGSMDTRDGDEELGGSMDTRDDENDEMKRRAEQILKESMENPLDEELGGSMDTGDGDEELGGSMETRDGNEELGGSMDTRVGNEELGGSMDTRDDEKDEMKRRAEQILKESMENPSDPAQL